MIKLLAALAYVFAFLVAGSAYAQTSFVNPTPNGGYIVNRPGGPTTFVNPTPNGGYIANTPGYRTTFANPTPNGGYIVNSPAQRPAGGMYSSPSGGMYGR